MNKFFIYISAVFFISCTSHDNKESFNAEKKHTDSSEIKQIENKLNYNIGRVQTTSVSCIGSTKPIISQNPILIKFDLDLESGRVKGTQFERVTINSSPNIDCVNTLKRSSVEKEYSQFYGLKVAENSYLINHFIVGDDKLVLQQKRGQPSALDINQDGKADFFDMCYSSEGLHFNIWDSPNKKVKLFHDAVYLDFNTIDNCEDRDYTES
jgi:hypothetical protein